MTLLRRFHILMVPYVMMLAGCEPIYTPDPDTCDVDERAFFTNSNQLEFELDLPEEERTLVSFTLRNDACRSVRFNYLTDVYGDDAEHFHVFPPPEGYEPWIKTRDAIEVTVEFSAEKTGTYNDAWIQIEFSYPEAEGTNAVGEMKRIQLYGHAL